MYEFEDTHDFDFKKNFFFDFIKYSLDNDFLKLAKNDEFLRGTSLEQVELWQKAFPKQESDLLSEDGLFYDWFFLSKCHAGFVWVFPQEDGSIHEHWT